MSEIDLFIQAILQDTPCTAMCKYGRFYNGYPDCTLNWCNNKEKHEFDFDKFIKEYDLEEEAAKENIGQVIILPFKIGDRAYRICDQYTEHSGCCSCLMLNKCEYFDDVNFVCSNFLGKRGKYEIISIMMDYKYIPEVGKTIFATKDEAEAKIVELNNKSEVSNE